MVSADSTRTSRSLGRSPPTDRIVENVPAHAPAPAIGRYTYTPRMSAGFCAVTPNPRRAAPAPARTVRWLSSSSAASRSAVASRCGATAPSRR